MAAAANQQRLRYRKMEKANLLCRPTQSTHKIGEDAMDTGLIHVQLLVFISSD
jgi:hypothetical protein